MARFSFSVLASIGALAIVGGVVATRESDSNEPRGIRNKNPGNLVITDIPWVGKVPVDENTDGTFEQFYQAEYGIRALYRDVSGDVERDGLNTPRKLITEYAPPHENNTEAYIQFVSNRLNISPDSVILPFQYPSLVAAIIEIENGKNPYNLAFIEYSSLITA